MWSCVVELNEGGLSPVRPLFIQYFCQFSHKVREAVTISRSMLKVIANETIWPNYHIYLQAVYLLRYSFANWTFLLAPCLFSRIFLLEHALIKIQYYEALVYLSYETSREEVPQNQIPSGINKFLMRLKLLIHVV